MKISIICDEGSCSNEVEEAYCSKCLSDKLEESFQTGYEKGFDVGYEEGCDDCAKSTEQEQANRIKP